MRTSTVPLLPILRSKLQGDILAQVYLNSSPRGLSITELSSLCKADIKNVSREVQRLKVNGYAKTQKAGRTTLVEPVSDKHFSAPLKQLLLVTLGPHVELTKIIQDIKDEYEAKIKMAYIYGSWARRYNGEEGHVPNDIDVALIGEGIPNRIAGEIEMVARTQFKHEVNIQCFETQDWDDPNANSMFLKSIRETPLVKLI